MTTTTTFQGLDPGSKSSSRVLRPPGGGSNISFGADEDKQATRKDKMASSIFAEPEDPHAHRRNNPPGGKPTGVLCGESSAPLRRCQNQHPSQNNEPNGQNSTSQDNSAEDADQDVMNAAEPMEEAAVAAQEDGRDESAPSGGSSGQAAGVPSGRRNPPGGKSSLILG